MPTSESPNSILPRRAVGFVAARFFGFLMAHAVRALLPVDDKEQSVVSCGFGIHTNRQAGRQADRQ